MRPYLNSGLPDLRAVFLLRVDDLPALKVLAAELVHRKTPAARTLADEVATRIKKLETKKKDASPRKNRDSAPDSQLKKIHDRVKQLEILLDAARRREIQLQQELNAAKSKRDQPLSDLGRVHLADTAPGWLIAAARTAFRKQYHPDRYQDPAKRQKAHEVFVAADAIFDKLEST